MPKSNRRREREWLHEATAPSRFDDEDEVNAKLTAQDAQNIDDSKFDKGFWKADARNPQGKDVDLLDDPDYGSVVAEQQD